MLQWQRCAGAPRMPSTGRSRRRLTRPSRGCVPVQRGRGQRTRALRSQGQWQWALQRALGSNGARQSTGPCCAHLPCVAHAAAHTRTHFAAHHSAEERQVCNSPTAGVTFAGSHFSASNCAAAARSAAAMAVPLGPPDAASASAPESLSVSAAALNAAGKSCSSTGGAKTTVNSSIAIGPELSCVRLRVRLWTARNTARWLASRGARPQCVDCTSHRACKARAASANHGSNVQS